MELNTNEIEALLSAAPLHSQEQTENPAILVKFFTPWTNWTWFVVEGQKQGAGEWEFFGMVHGFEKELGYFTLSELESLQGPGGLRVERDPYYTGHHLNDVR